MKLTARRMSALSLGGAVLLVTAFSTSAAAQAPGPPDFYWPYGLVQADGANLAPVVQPVVAYVNGKVCGRGQTLVAIAGDNVPAGDIGKTVYKIDVKADGTRVDQSPGCGKTGDGVTLYFPASRRFAIQTAAFHQGGERIDLTLGPALQYRAIGPAAARDSGP